LQFCDINKKILSGDVNKYKNCNDSAVRTTEIDARWKTASETQLRIGLNWRQYGYKFTSKGLIGKLAV
jgi:hypothetical protein